MARLQVVQCLAVVALSVRGAAAAAKAAKSRDSGAALTLLEEASRADVQTTSFPSQRTTRGLVHATSPLSFSYVKVLPLRPDTSEEALRAELGPAGCRGLKAWVAENMSGDEPRRVSVDGGKPTAWEAFWGTYGGGAVEPEMAVLHLDGEFGHYKAADASMTHGHAVVRCEMQVPQLEGREVRWVHDEERRFVACIPPIYTMEGTNWEWILTWIEYHAANGLSAVQFYTNGHDTGATTLSAEVQAALVELGRDKGVDIAHTDVSELLNDKVRTFYHGQRESARDCALRSDAMGAEWALFCDWDEFLTPFPERAALDAGEHLFDEVVRLAAEDAGKSHQDVSAITLGSWTGNATECVGEGNTGLVADYKAARSAFNDASATHADPEPTSRLLLDQSRNLQALVQGEAFSRAAAPFCQVGHGKLILGGSDMLCFRRRSLHQGGGHRKFMARPADLKAFTVHNPALAGESSKKAVHLSADSVHMLHLRGVQVMDQEGVCESVASHDDAYSKHRALAEIRERKRSRQRQRQRQQAGRT